MVEASRARSGAPILLASGKPLNSRYDPKLEAESFVARTLKGESPEAIIIVGETLGYLTRATRAVFPASSILSVFLSDELRPHAPDDVDSACFPDESGVVRDLADAISEITYDHTSIVRWEPSLRQWPEVANSVLTTLRDALLISSGNRSTTAAFGRRWLSNIVRNLLELPDTIVDIAGTRPVCIAASGPSLERSLEAIVPLTDRVEIWALPSSVSAFAARDIRPQVVISTDAGYYASTHYRRLPDAGVVTVAFPLTAYPGAFRASARVALLNQGSFFERSLYRRLRLPHTYVPANGTVAGSALELALSRRTPILFIGLDLSVIAGQEHARPHPFHDMLIRSSTRFGPTESSVFSRAMELYPDQIASQNRTNMPLRTYASWFRKRIAEAPAPSVYRVFPSCVEIDGMVPLDLHEVRSFLDRFPPDRTTRVPPTGARTPPLEERRESIRAVIAEWIDRLSRTDPASPFQEEDVIHLLYLLDTQRCVEARTQFRLSDANARRLARESLHAASDFLRRELNRLGSSVHGY